MYKTGRRGGCLFAPLLFFILVIAGGWGLFPRSSPPTPPPVVLNESWKIVGYHDDRDVEVTADRLHGGAIYSLKWAGTEFVDATDNGRELQTAWTHNDKGEADNPTEAGASADGTPPSHSTTVVLEARNDDNKIHTYAQLAYWYPLNGQTLSPYKLGKTVTIGYNGLTNVLHHQITATIVGDKDKINMEGLTLYSPTSFTRFFVYDLKTGSKIEIASPGKMVYNQPNPVIIANSDLSRAITLYGKDFYFYGSGMLPKLNCCSWQRGPIPAGDISWEAFTVFGTFDQVVAALGKLNEK